MALTPSEVASLTRSLSRWEIAEYISSGLVTLACVGEYIANFKFWFTGGDKDKKERLSKRSTLLLIACLSFELICLVKTNHLSGKIIGALDDKAESASEKSGQAILNANSAIATAQVAKDTSSAAESLAQGARHDVEVVGKDLDSAKERVYALSGNLTEANRKADEELQARVKLEAQLINVEVCNSPRVILSWSTNGKTSVDQLKPLAGRTVFIEFLADNEARRAALNIAGTLTSAKWDVRPLKVVDGIEDGVVVQPYVAAASGEGIENEWRAGEVADALIDFLHSYNWQVRRGWPTDATGHLIRDDSILPPGSVRIQVGLYPAVMYVPPPGAAGISQALAELEKQVERARVESQRITQEARRKMLESLPPERRKLMEQRAEEFDRDSEKMMSRYSNPCQSFPRSLLWH